MQTTVLVILCCILLSACSASQIPDDHAAMIDRANSETGSAEPEENDVPPVAPFFDENLPAGSHLFEALESIGSANVQRLTGDSSTNHTQIRQPLPLGDDFSLVSYKQHGVTEDEMLLVSVEDMELMRFIHLVFGSYLKVNYIVDPKLQKRKEKVTIHMQEPVTVPEFKQLARELLARYKISVREKQRIVYIEPQQGKKSSIEEDFTIVIGNVLPPGLLESDIVICFATTRYIDASKYINILKRIKPKSSEELLSQSPNSLIIKGDAGTVRKILDLVAAFDKPYLQEQKVILLELKYMQPELFQERLKELLLPLGIPVGESRNDSGIKIVMIPEINSLLIISPEEKWLGTIKKWADRLDTPAILGPAPRIFIYRPKNRKASALAKIILGLYNDGGQGPAKSLQSQRITERSADNVNVESDSKQSGKAGDDKVISIYKKDRISITVDEERNALVIFTTPKIYADAEKNLVELDTVARQVLVEVTIAEITLTDSLQYGVEWFIGKKLTEGTVTLSTLGRLALGDGGVLATFSQSSGNFLAMLNAFAEDDLVNILSRPRLVVLDNESATFSVGTDVPVVTSEATAPDLGGGPIDPSILRNIQYRKTGVSMSITPTIYSNGILRLEIDQNISEAQKNDVSPETDSPLILDRSLNTVVTLKSGEYILIGGLISETHSAGDQGIPFLRDIPILGTLFKTSSTQTTRTELMIQVRPVILENPTQAREETLNYENTLRKLQGLDELLDG